MWQLGNERMLLIGGVTLLQSQTICVLQTERQWIALDEEKVRQKNLLFFSIYNWNVCYHQEGKCRPALEARTKSGVNCDDFSAATSNK